MAGEVIMIKQNLHTHSLYCDGKDSFEEMIQTAIEKNFTILGFSSHGYTPDETLGMDEETILKYQKELKDLKNKYKDQISIYTGIEQDMLYRVKHPDSFDYIIGSKHCVNGTGYENGVDCSKEITKKIVQSQFSNDFLLYAKNYYEDIIQMADWDEVDIIGHFDLIMKYNEDQSFLSFSNRKYINMACDALDCLLSKGKIIEVNTGAMARGYRSQAYPEVHLLEYIASKNGKIILNSDCHNRKDLDAGYDSTLASLEKIGFKEMMVLTDCGFKAVDIKQFKRG